MTRRTPIPADLATSPFSIERARDRGLSIGRMRASDLAHPFQGVRTLSDSPVDPVAAYAQRMSPHAFFSHSTAAQLWGLPLPQRLKTLPLHVSVVKPHRAPRLENVVGHHCMPHSTSVVTKGTLRLSAPVDTWCSLAMLLTLDEMVIAGDWLTRRQKPLATLADLRSRVAAHSGRPGFRLLKQALALVRARTDSPRETLTRLTLVRAGLPEPVVNFEIRDAEGRFVAFGDLAFVKYKVLIEYDGGQHREDEEQFNRDVDRLDDIMQLDWRVVRINKSHSSSQIVAKAAAALGSRGWTPSRSGAKGGSVSRGEARTDI